jgi:exodeoxyribonuclease VII small subunit
MPDSKSVSFETSLARLQEIVADLEREGVELERAVALFDEGRTLVAQCERMLAAAEDRLRTTVPDAAAPDQESAEADDVGF